MRLRPLFLCAPPRCAAVTPRPCHRQRAGGGRVAPTGRPRARHALHALACAGHALPADSRETMAAGTAPDASCGGRPHSLPTRGVTAGRPAPGPALGVLLLRVIDRGQVHATGHQAPGIRQGKRCLELPHRGGVVALREGLDARRRHARPAPLLGRHGRDTAHHPAHDPSPVPRGVPPLAACHRSCSCHRLASRFPARARRSGARGGRLLSTRPSSLPSAAIRGVQTHHGCAGLAHGGGPPGGLCTTPQPCSTGGKKPARTLT